MKSITDMNKEELKQFCDEAVTEVLKVFDNMTIYPIPEIEIDVKEDKIKKKWKR